MSWDSAPIVAPGQQAATKPKAGWEAAPVAAPAPKGKLKADQVLGFVKGVEHPIDNLAIWLESGAKKLGVPTDKINDLVGLPSAREATASHAAAVERAASQGRRPGMIGETAGNIVGTAPALFEGPLVAGAMQGAALTDHPDDLGQVALDTAGGMALNKLVGVGVDKVADTIAPVIDPAVQKLHAAGVRLTPGQIKGGKAMAAEDKAMSRPFVGDRIAADRRAGLEDFNRGAVNRALYPLGIKLPDNVATGHDAIAFMQDAAGQAYDRIMPNLTLKPDARMMAGLRNAQQVFATLPEREQGLFRQLVMDKLVPPNGAPLTGRPLAVAIRDLRTAAAKYGASPEQSYRDLGEALSHVQDGVKSALTAQNPKFAPLLKAADTAYKGNVVVTKAASNADEGIFSTGQLKSGVRQADRTKNKRATASGRAFMQDYSDAGRQVLPAQTPDSGTAGRLMDGKWIPAARGAVDAGKYEIDKALTRLRLLPRSPEAKKLAGLLAQYKAPMSAIGGPAVGGLLAGLLGND